MLVIVKRTGANPEQLDVDDDLPTMQALVDGWIEELRAPVPGVVAYVNEDGRDRRDPINLTIAGVDVRGTIVLTAVAEGGTSRSLTDDEVASALAWLDSLGRERAAN